MRKKFYDIEFAEEIVHTYIIAEVGCNHNGDIEIAKEMTRQIAAAGCDAAKYQVFHASIR